MHFTDKEMTPRSQVLAKTTQEWLDRARTHPNQLWLQPERNMEMFAHPPLFKAPASLSTCLGPPIPHHSLLLICSSEFNSTSPSPNPSYFLVWIKYTHITTCAFLILILSYEKCHLTPLSTSAVYEFFKSVNGSHLSLILRGRTVNKYLSNIHQFGKTIF